MSNDGLSFNYLKIHNEYKKNKIFKSTLNKKTDMLFLFPIFFIIFENHCKYLLNTIIFYIFVYLFHEFGMERLDLIDKIRKKNILVLTFLAKILYYNK